MPIKRENKSKYPANWKQVRARILEREGNCCKFCKAPNHIFVSRSACGRYYMLPSGDIRSSQSGASIDLNEVEPIEFPIGKWIDIVLTVAHLDHNPENCADENLAALCQRCHNRHDVPQRVESRRRTRDKKAKAA